MKLILQLFAGTALSALAFAPAYSQSPTPSRVTPETFVPLAARGSNGISFGQVEPGQVPAGADKLLVTVGAVVVEGRSEEFRPAIDAATAKVKGRNVSAKTLYGVAAEIEAAYARAGYVLTRVTVPPQKLDNGGTFRLLVVDGFIESIDESAVPQQQRAAVEARLKGLVGVKGLKLIDIERKLLIAGDIPGVRLRSALVKGMQPGGAKLVVEGDWRPVSASVGVDNKVGKIYRNVEFPISASLNSVFGIGEQIYGSAITGPDADTLVSGSPIRRVYGLGALVPIGIDGWMVNPEYTRSNTNPRILLPATPTTGVFERFAFRSLYPVIKTRQQTLTATGSFEVMNETQTATALGTALNIDRLRIVTFGLEATKSLDWSANVSGGLLVTQGIDGLGARSQAAATASGIPLSRQGSRPDYEKIEGHLRYDQALPYDLTGAAIFRAQQAISGPMPSAAQFALDGEDGLSSFPIGTLSTDSGFTARAEFGRPFRFDKVPFAGVVAPYLFAAWGVGTIDNPSAAETARLVANAFGAGLRVNLAETSSGVTSFATLEVGRTHSTITANDTRVTLSWTVKY